MNKIKVLLIVLFFGINGCEKINSDTTTEKRIAEKIAKHIIENDSLKKHTYSSDVFLNIISEKLNDKNYKTLISLNGLKSKSTEFKTESINIDGFKTIIYYNISKIEYNLPDQFFVPDSRNWSFLVELIGNDIILYKMELEIKKDHSTDEKLDEIDF